MKIKKLLPLMLLLVSSCEEITEAIIEGCTTTTACNYDATAMKDDGSCVAPQGCNEWCVGDTLSAQGLDCANVCGGSSIISECGICHSISISNSDELLGNWEGVSSTYNIHDWKFSDIAWHGSITNTLSGDSLLVEWYSCGRFYNYINNYPYLDLERKSSIDSLKQHFIYNLNESGLEMYLLYEINFINGSDTTFHECNFMHDKFINMDEFPGCQTRPM